MNRGDRGSDRPSLGIVGAGRAGSALAVGLAASGYRVVAVASRRLERARELADRVNAEAVATAVVVAARADVTVLAVPDAAVTSVGATIAAGGLALRGRGLVHIAARFGTEPLVAARITGAAVGVLHPLQALAGPASAPLLRGSSFRVEADAALRPTLLGLVDALRGHVLDVPADARTLYHAAAVLAGNAPLALLAAAEQLLVDAGLEARTAHTALAALLHGAATNALESGAQAALTGPVARGDAATVRAHVEALLPHPDALALYLAAGRETARLAGRDPQAAGLVVEDRRPSLTVQRVA